MAKKKPKLSEEQRATNMKFVASMLMCPHQWSGARNVSVVDGKKKPRRGKHSACTACGTNRIDWDDGTSSLMPSGSLSDAPVA